MLDVGKDGDSGDVRPASALGSELDSPTRSFPSSLSGDPTPKIFTVWSFPENDGQRLKWWSGNKTNTQLMTDSR